MSALNGRTLTKQMAASLLVLIGIGAAFVGNRPVNIVLGVLIVIVGMLTIVTTLKHRGEQ